MKLSGLTKMVKRQLVCNVFYNDESDDFYIGTASAIYCATGFPRPLNRSQMGALLGIGEETMIDKVVYNDYDGSYKNDLSGFNLDDTAKGEVEVKKMAVGIYYMGEILIPVTTEDKHMVGLICWSQLAPVEDEIKNNGFIRSGIWRTICAWQNFSQMKKTERSKRTSSEQMLLMLPCIGEIPCGRKWKSCITVAFSLLQFRM